MRLELPVAIPPGRHTDGFGARPSFTAGEFITGAMHGGTDIAAPAGTPVHSAGPGRVVAIRKGATDLNVWGNRPVYHRSAGNFAIVEHIDQRPFLTAWGIAHLRIWLGYAHLRAVHVYADQRVAAGDRIGEVGATGAATGPHLHLDLFTDSPSLGDRAFARRLDPLTLLKGHPLMALTDDEQERLARRVDALYDALAKPNERGWTFPAIVQSHVVATLAEVRADGGTDLGLHDLAATIAEAIPDDLAEQVVDLLAARLAAGA